MIDLLDLKKALLAIFALLTIWSAIAPADVFTWWLEAVPAFIGLAIVVFTYKKFPLTNFLYIMLTLHAAVLLVGAHYTYAEVPLFNWIRDEFGFSRNHYDRLGHFFQGLVPALIARELLLRTSPLQNGKWLFVIITLGCLGISSAYELVEWLVSINTGDKSDAFLGTQGDVWDTQKDMCMALIGAVFAQLIFGATHNKALDKHGNGRSKIQ
jgi:putative membrane protein